MSGYTLIRKRSLLARILYAPKVFMGHYRAFRIMRINPIEAAKVSWMFVGCLFPRKAA